MCHSHASYTPPDDFFFHLLGQVSLVTFFIFVQMCEIQRYTSFSKKEKEIKSKEKERKENSSESVDAGRLKRKDRNFK